MSKEKVIKKQNGITLIALIVTIIVLLILAAVSIATLTGENGILTRVNDAKIEQSHGAVRDGIALAYNEWQIEINTISSNKLNDNNLITNDNNISIDTEIKTANKNMIRAKETKLTATTSITFLNFLKDKKYIKENTENIINVEKLTGVKQTLGNGTDNDIYTIEEQEENYIVIYIDNNNNKQEIWKMSKQQRSNIELNILKVPENESEKVGSVVLKLILKQDNAQGEIVEKLNQEEYENKLLEELQKIGETEKENIYVEILNINYGTDLKNIDEFIKILNDSGKISENSKDAFYNEYVRGKRKI